MDELINAVASKTGLPHDLAKVAVVTVLNHVKAQLPKVLADQIDSYLGTAGGTDGAQKSDGQPQSSDVVGAVLKGIGGILNKKK